MKHILVLKLSALGDFIQATGPFAAIRAHHAGDHVTLLTTQPFAELARQSPYFDDVWIDARPRIWDVAGMMRLRGRLRSVKFDMVYDLQTSDRSSGYFLMMNEPPWSGIAHGCAYPHANPDRDFMHTLERQAEQLAMAGIPATPPPDLSWLTSDLSRFQLPRRLLLLVPGGAPHRPGKRWPAERFAAIANKAADNDILPLLLGTKADREPIKEILKTCPYARSLMDQTSFADIAELARHALGAVANDTGPAHLIAAAGCPLVVLFSQDSDPSLCAPRGKVAVLRHVNLAELETDEVWQALESGPAALRESPAPTP